MSISLQPGDRVWLSGDCADLWIQDYNVRLDSGATILEAPVRGAKKVLVCVDSIDHDSDVVLCVKRAACKPIT